MINKWHSRQRTRCCLLTVYYWWSELKWERSLRKRLRNTRVGWTRQKPWCRKGVVIFDRRIKSRVHSKLSRCVRKYLVNSRVTISFNQCVLLASVVIVACSESNHLATLLHENDVKRVYLRSTYTFGMLISFVAGYCLMRNGFSSLTSEWTLSGPHLSHSQWIPLVLSLKMLVCLPFAIQQVWLFRFSRSICSCCTSSCFNLVLLFCLPINHHYRSFVFTLSNNSQNFKFKSVFAPARVWFWIWVVYLYCFCSFS